MTTTHIEGAVTLADIAQRTRTKVATVEQEALDLGMFVGVRWDGEPAVSEVDARSLVTGQGRRTADHAIAERRHDDECRAWEAARDAHTAQASQAAYVAATARGHGAPGAASEASAAAVDAGRDFEASTPPPTFGAGSHAVRRFTQRVIERVTS